MIIIFSFNISLTRFFQELKSIPDQQVSLCECFASFGQIQGRSCFGPQEKIQRFLSFELTLAVVFQLSLLLFFRFLSGHSLFCLRMPRQSKKMVTPVCIVVVWGRYQTLPLVPKVPFFSDIDDYQSFQVWGYKPRGSPCELYTLIITCQGHISNVRVISSHL